MITVSGAAVAGSQFEPADHGLISWSFDVAESNAAQVPAVGALNLVKLPLRRAATITNVLLAVNTAGVSLTAGQCFAGLWLPNKTLVGITADQATAWQSTGTKVMPLVGGPYAVSTPYVYVGWWENWSGSGAAFQRASSAPSGPFNVGLTAADYRFANADSGLTTTAPNPFGVMATWSICYWAAVS